MKLAPASSYSPTMDQAYQSYFQAQAGGGAVAEPGIGPLYKASFAQQSGRGCCGIGRVLTAAATPLIVKGVRAVSDEVANASFGLYQDLQQDATLPAIRTAAISRANQIRRNLARRARSTLVGRGSRKPAKKKKKPTPRRKTQPRKRKTARKKPPQKSRIKRRTRTINRQTGGGLQDERTNDLDIFS